MPVIWAEFEFPGAISNPPRRGARLLPQATAVTVAIDRWLKDLAGDL
jgi:hypothetical protein